MTNWASYVNADQAIGDRPHPGAQQLDGDDSSELDVPPFPHLAHRAAADQPLELVAARQHRVLAACPDFAQRHQGVGCGVVIHRALFYQTAQRGFADRGDDIGCRVCVTARASATLREAVEFLRTTT